MIIYKQWYKVTGLVTLKVVGEPKKQPRAVNLQEGEDDPDSPNYNPFEYPDAMRKGTNPENK